MVSGRAGGGAQMSPASISAWYHLYGSLELRPDAVRVLLESFCDVRVQCL